MSMNSFVPVTAVLALVLAGCGGSSTTPTESTAPVAPADGGFEPITNVSSDGGLAEFQRLCPDCRPEDRELIQNNLIVYFEFDRSEIRPEFNEMLAAHGRWLASDPMRAVRLEGHADERGSREYNIGLGERRALAVRQILLLGGAQAAQVTTVSYGEERAAVFGSDEESYSLNRRVELVYR